MSVHDFMKDHILECYEIIHTDIKDNTFDSHQFIQHFSKKFEAEYVGFLSQYQTNCFMTVNAQIAQFLENHKTDLGIIDRGKTSSQDVFGNSTPNESWEKVN